MMVLGKAKSVEGVTIRLTDERWEHVLDSRPYMRGYEEDVLDVVGNPEAVLRIAGGVQVAIVSYGRKGFLHVLYKEVSHADGFIITAYFKDSYNRRQVIWRADEK